MIPPNPLHKNIVPSDLESDLPLTEEAKLELLTILHSPYETESGKRFIAQITRKLDGEDTSKYADVLKPKSFDVENLVYNPESGEFIIRVKYANKSCRLAFNYAEGEFTNIRILSEGMSRREFILGMGSGLILVATGQPLARHNQPENTTEIELPERLDSEVTNPNINTITFLNKHFDVRQLLGIELDLDQNNHLVFQEAGTCEFNMDEQKLDRLEQLFEIELSTEQKQRLIRNFERIRKLMRLEFVFGPISPFNLDRQHGHTNESDNPLLEAWFLIYYYSSVRPSAQESMDQSTLNQIRQLVFILASEPKPRITVANEVEVTRRLSPIERRRQRFLSYQFFTPDVEFLNNEELQNVNEKFNNICIDHTLRKGHLRRILLNIFDDQDLEGTQIDEFRTYLNNPASAENDTQEMLRETLIGYLIQKFQEIFGNEIPVLHDFTNKESLYQYLYHDEVNKLDNTMKTITGWYIASLSQSILVDFGQFYRPQDPPNTTKINNLIILAAISGDLPSFSILTQDKISQLRNYVIQKLRTAWTDLSSNFDPDSVVFYDINSMWENFRQPRKSSEQTPYSNLLSNVVQIYTNHPSYLFNRINKIAVEESRFRGLYSYPDRVILKAQHNNSTSIEYTPSTLEHEVDHGFGDRILALENTLLWVDNQYLNRYLLELSALYTGGIENSVHMLGMIELRTVDEVEQRTLLEKYQELDFINEGLPAAGEFVYSSVYPYLLFRLRNHLIVNPDSNITPREVEVLNAASKVVRKEINHGLQGRVTTTELSPHRIASIAELSYLDPAKISQMDYITKLELFHYIIERLHNENKLHLLSLDIMNRLTNVTESADEEIFNQNLNLIVSEYSRIQNTAVFTPKVDQFAFKIGLFSLRLSGEDPAIDFSENFALTRVLAQSVIDLYNKDNLSENQRREVLIELRSALMRIEQIDITSTISQMVDRIKVSIETSGNDVLSVYKPDLDLFDQFKNEFQSLAESE